MMTSSCVFLLSGYGCCRALLHSTSAADVADKSGLPFPDIDFPARQVEEVETALSSMPTVTVTAACEVDGEPEAQVQAEDVVTCKARVLLSRPSHATHGASPHFCPVAPGLRLTRLTSQAAQVDECASSCQQCGARNDERATYLCLHLELTSAEENAAHLTCR
jgi:hypothetical protein